MQCVEVTGPRNFAMKNWLGRGDLKVSRLRSFVKFLTVFRNDHKPNLFETTK